MTRLLDADEPIYWRDKMMAEARNPIETPETRQLAADALAVLERIHRQELKLADGFDAMVAVLDAYRALHGLSLDAAGYVRAGDALGGAAFGTSVLRGRPLNDFFVGEELRRSQARGMLAFMSFFDQGSPGVIAGGKGLQRFIREAKLDNQIVYY